MPRLTDDSTVRSLEALCEAHRPPCARHTGRLSAMGVVKWDRCWGLKRPQWESENDASAARVRQLRDENMGGAEGSLFTTPDLLRNTFSLIGESRIGLLRSFALKVGEDKRVQANSNMILWLTESSREMREFTRLTLLKVCSETIFSQGAPIRGPDHWPFSSPSVGFTNWLCVKIAAASVFRKEGNTKEPKKQKQ